MNQSFDFCGFGKEGFFMIKKMAVLFALLAALSGCASGTNVDELISAKELPEYGDSVDIQVNESAGGNAEAINID